MKTVCGSYTIRSISIFRKGYIRTGGDFVLTFMWNAWGIEICRCDAEWSPYGTTVRYFGFRWAGLRAQLLFGKMKDYAPPSFITRHKRWCLVTNKTAWPDVIDA